MPAEGPFVPINTPYHQPPHHVFNQLMKAAVLDGTTAQIVGSVVLYLTSSLSAAAGVGGGALNVPIFYLIWGFTYRESVVMSLATLMGNYLCQVIINLPERHPIVRERPLIYWDAVLVLLPAELGGANIGVILAAIFPDSLCVILGMIVLLIAGTCTQLVMYTSLLLTLLLSFSPLPIHCLILILLLLLLLLLLFLLLLRALVLTGTAVTHKGLQLHEKESAALLMYDHFTITSSHHTLSHHTATVTVSHHTLSIIIYPRMSHSTVSVTVIQQGDRRVTQLCLRKAWLCPCWQITTVTAMVVMAKEVEVGVVREEMIKILATTTATAATTIIAAAITTTAAATITAVTMIVNSTPHPPPLLPRLPPPPPPLLLPRVLVAV